MNKPLSALARVAALLASLGGCALQASAPEAFQAASAPGARLAPTAPPIQHRPPFNADAEILQHALMLVHEHYLRPLSYPRLLSLALTALRQHQPPLSAAQAERLAAALAAAEAAETEPAALELLPNILDALDQAAPPGAVSRAALRDAMLAGLANSLDPHSSYANAETIRALQRPSQGSQWASVGLYLRRPIANGPVEIVALAEGGPALGADLRPGDRLLAVDGQPLAALPLEAAVALLRGPIGSTALLELGRQGETRTLSIIRRPIARPAPVLERLDGMALVRLVTIAEGAAAALDRQLRAMDPAPLGLVLDLRGNTGGLLSEAVKLAEWLLPADSPILIAEGRRPQDRQVWRGGGRGQTSLPLVVLVDPQTAAGAEILAAAVQTARRGVLLGERTHGAGTIQTLLPLRAGGALRLTTSLVRLADGRLLQRHGVLPDLAVQRRSGPPPQRAENSPRELTNPEPRPTQPPPWPALAALHARAPLHLPEVGPDRDGAADPMLRQAVDVLRLLNQR